MSTLQSSRQINECLCLDSSCTDVPLCAGVLTKLDIMDRGTNAVNVLKNEVVPLRLGYIGDHSRLLCSDHSLLLDLGLFPGRLGTLLQQLPVYLCFAIRHDGSCSNLLRWSLQSETFLGCRCGQSMSRRHQQLTQHG